MDSEESFFGKPPIGAPTDMLRYREPTLFEMLKTVEREGEATRMSNADLASRLVNEIKGSPDINWGPFVGGGLGGAAGYLGARYLTNLSQKSQLAAAGGGATLGALIGQAIQGIARARRAAELSKKADFSGFVHGVGEVGKELSGIGPMSRSLHDVGRAYNIAREGGGVKETTKPIGSSIGHAATLLTGWLPFVPAAGKLRYLRNPLTRLSGLSKGLARAPMVPQSFRRGINRFGTRLGQWDSYVPAAAKGKSLLSADAWTGRFKDPKWWGVNAAENAMFMAPLAGSMALSHVRPAEVRPKPAPELANLVKYLNNVINQGHP